MTYRDLYVQAKTAIYTAWNDLEDALLQACECEEWDDPVRKELALYHAAEHADKLGAAAVAAVERMRKGE